MGGSTRRDFLKALGVGAAAAAVPKTLWAKAPADKPPDIVLIMSDDMGFSDLACYGGEIHTPNLDRLAANGLRFTQFYNTARCCPTRASLISGLYMHQAGVGHMMGDRGLPGYRGNLARNCVTIAEALRPAGYRCYMAGKWHVTRHTDPDGPKFNWPCQRGFHRFYGTIHGAGSFYDPNTLTRDNTMISPYADPQYKPKRFYYTDAISDHAARYVAEHHKQHADKPLFMYVAYTAAHWPMHALGEDVAKYKGKYDGGYKPVRKARFERAKKLGLIRKDWKLSEQAEDWSRVRHKAWEARCMEVYAAMVDRMDAGIGRIVDALREAGRLDNTLIFFLQDNGGCAEGLGRASRGKYKTRPDTPPFDPMPPDALQKSMIPRQTRDGYPTVMGPGVMPGPDGTYIAYGRGWANVSNTPFRKYKHWVHEGGIATPLIVHWPARVKDKGALRRDPGHLIDIMATCVDVGGATYPTEYKGNKIQAMEGKSLAGVFGGRRLGERAIFWEHEGNRAVRKGKWKLVADYRGAWELYDMEADRTELNDLAAKHGEKVKELSALYDAWAQRCNVVPWGELHRRRRDDNVGSKRSEFELKAGDKLPRGKCPRIAGKALMVTATFTAAKGGGVILAQGGSSLGYALYVADGRVAFATRDGGRLAVAAAKDALPAGRVTVVARLAKDGTLTLTIDDKPAAKAKSAGPISRMPLDGLEVGADENGAVGQYEPPNEFKGKIEKVHIRLGK